MPFSHYVNPTNPNKGHRDQPATAICGESAAAWEQSETPSCWTCQTLLSRRGATGRDALRDAGVTLANGGR